jgi:hypothetical protein
MDNKPIISAALAYDEPMTGEVVILVVHNAILIDEMDNNLLCPMQLRMNDVKVDECPRYLADNPDDNSHSIRFPNDDNFLIPLYLHGVTSYFNTRKPTQAEYQTCRQIEMTYDLPDWNPHSLTFAEQEENYIDSFGKTRVPESSHRFHNRRLCLVQNSISMIAAESGADREKAQIVSDRNSQCSSVLSDISNTLNDDTFYNALVSQVQVSYTSSSLASKKGRRGISAEHVAKNWGISIEQAKQTVARTTQRGIRTVANPSISR